MQERSERQRFERRDAVLRATKKEERAKVAAGIKTPYYLKKKEKRRVELLDRYEHLAKEGRLGKALEKKRKRNAAKDHRWLPRSRREEGQGGDEE